VPPTSPAPDLDAEIALPRSGPNLGVVVGVAAAGLFALALAGAALFFVLH
jgi:hypothetical protein